MELIITSLDDGVTMSEYLKKMISNKLHLVTGGSGFLGGKVIERIQSYGGEVIALSRNEGKLIEL